jgi:hypothetical protein
MHLTRLHQPDRYFRFDLLDRFGCWRAPPLGPAARRALARVIASAAGST